MFFVHPAETIDLHYERKRADPRIQHQMVLGVDDFGNVTRSAALAYPRRTPEEPEQGRMWVTITDARFANRPGEADWYRVGVPIESQVGELTGMIAPTSDRLMPLTVSHVIDIATEIPFETAASDNAFQRRVVKRQRTLYYKDDLTGPLALDVIESRALPYESYQQALTPGLVTAVYGDRVTSDMLISQGRYVLQDGVWWAPSGRVIPDPARFYLPVEAIDPFGEHYLLRYDGYALLPLETEDPLGNRVTVGLRNATGQITQSGHDYRVLGPVLITDPNRNRTAVAMDGNREAVTMDALGMVIKTAVMGKDGAGEGDTLDDPTTRIDYDPPTTAAPAATRPVWRSTWRGTAP